MEIKIRTQEDLHHDGIRLDIAADRHEAAELVERLLGRETASADEMTELRGQRDEAWSRIEFLKQTIDGASEKNAGLAEKLKIADTAAREQRNTTADLEKRLRQLRDKIDAVARIVNHGNVSTALHSAVDAVDEPVLTGAIREIRRALNA